MMFRWRMVPTFARAMCHAFVFWLEGKPVFAPKPIIVWRRGRCKTCPESTPELFPQCKICACFTEPKITLSSESCPIGRWYALDNRPKSQ